LGLGWGWVYFYTMQGGRIETAGLEPRFRVGSVMTNTLRLAEPRHFVDCHQRQMVVVFIITKTAAHNRLLLFCFFFLLFPPKENTH